MHPFRFALHTSIAPTMAEWRERARMAEGLGYSALYVTDHLDTQFGPLVAATVAAEATTSLHVGMLVLNNDLRNPVVLAKEIATLALAAEGRIEVGLGAGWRSDDYGEAGIAYESAGVRVDRLAEGLTIMKALWNEEETTFTGEHYTVRGARCDPSPGSPPRIIVGGGSKRVLTVAAHHADIVNVSLASAEKGGELAERATLDHFDRCLAWIHESAGDIGALEIQSTTSSVIFVNSRRAAVRSVTMLGLRGEEALDLPIVLIGTADEIGEQLMSRRERWGFNNVVVPGDAMETFAPVVARLAGT
jgi:probable F420-dependent oxidoreductase